MIFYRRLIAIYLGSPTVAVDPDFHETTRVAF